MKLQLNGAPHDANVATLAELLQAEGFGDAKVASAVNSVFIPVPDRSAHLLNDGDRVEILAPMQGG